MTGTLREYMLRELGLRAANQPVPQRTTGEDVLENFQLSLPENISDERVGDVIVANFQEEEYTLIDENTTDFTFEKEEEGLRVDLSCGDGIMNISLIKI